MGWFYRCYSCNHEIEREPYDSDPRRECEHCGEECCEDCVDEHMDDCSRNPVNQEDEDDE